MSYSRLGLGRFQPLAFAGPAASAQAYAQDKLSELKSDANEGYNKAVSYIYDKIDRDPELKAALSPLTKLQLEGVKMASVGVAKAILSGGDVVGSLDSLSSAVEEVLVNQVISGAVDAIAAAVGVAVPGVGTALSALYFTGKALFNSYQEKVEQDCRRVRYAQNLALHQAGGRWMGSSSHQEYMGSLKSACSAASTAPVRVDPNRIFPAEYFAPVAIQDGSKQVKQMPSLGQSLMSITELTPEDFQALRWYKNAKKVSKDLSWTWNAVFPNPTGTRGDEQLFEKQFATTMFSPNFNLNDLMSKSSDECGLTFPKLAHSKWQSAVIAYMKKEGYNLLIPEMSGNASVSGRLGFEVADDVFGAAPMTQFVGNSDVIPRSTYYSWWVTPRTSPCSDDPQSAKCEINPEFVGYFYEFGKDQKKIGYWLFPAGRQPKKPDGAWEDYAYFNAQFLMPPPVWNISKTDQKMFRDIREAIQSQYRNPNGNGGDELWPLYLDLIVKQFRQGKINDSAVCLLISRKILPKGCFDFNHSVLYDLYGLLDTWAASSNPSTMYKSSRDALDKKIAEAKSALAAFQAKKIANLKISSQTAEAIIKKAKAKKVKLSAGTMKLKMTPAILASMKDVKLRSKEKVSTNALLLGGVGIASLLGYLYFRQKKKK